MRPFLTCKDRMGSRVERVGFACGTRKGDAVVTTTLTRLPRVNFHFKNPSSAIRVQRFVRRLLFATQSHS
jgi:hypothetical protein